DDLVAGEDARAGDVAGEAHGRDLAADLLDELPQRGHARLERGRRPGVERLELLERLGELAEPLQRAAAVVEQRRITRELVRAAVRGERVAVLELAHRGVGLLLEPRGLAALPLRGRALIGPGAARRSGDHD